MITTNIGFFTDTYFPQINGVTYTLSLWERVLKSLNKHVYIYYPKSKHKPKNNEIPLKSLNFSRYKGYRVILPFSTPKYSDELDIVHLHGLVSSAVIAKYVCRKFKLPSVVSYHTPLNMYIKYLSTIENLNRGVLKVYNFWENRVLNSCNFVLAPSNIIKNTLLKKNVKNVKVLSNGVDMDFFQPKNAKKFKEKLGITNEKVIGYCGRLSFEKRLQDLIAIADEFDGDILLIGDGPGYEYYKNLSRSKPNVKIFKFLKRKELPYFYSCLDLFVHPSIAETQGIVALESMACGTPVIGANSLALKETISENTGYLYEPGNKKDLLKKINDFYKNKEKKEFSKYCIRYAKKHSIKKTVKELIKIYESVV